MAEGQRAQNEIDRAQALALEVNSGTLGELASAIDELTKTLIKELHGTPQDGDLGAVASNHMQNPQVVLWGS